MFKLFYHKVIYGKGVNCKIINFKGCKKILHLIHKKLRKRYKTLWICNINFSLLKHFTRSSGIRPKANIEDQETRVQRAFSAHRNAENQYCREMVDSNKLSTPGNHGFQDVLQPLNAPARKSSARSAWYTGSSACWNRKTVQTGKEWKRRLAAERERARERKREGEGRRTRCREYWTKKYWCRVPIHAVLRVSPEVNRGSSQLESNVIIFKNHSQKYLILKKILYVSYMLL